MSHCANCQEIDRLNRQRDKAYDDRREAMALKRRVEKWATGRGLLRFFLSWTYRQTMFEGACLVIADATVRIVKLEADIEKAEKSTIEGQVKHAARKMANDLAADLDKPQDPVAAVKGFAALLDADLKFEDKVADLKLTDLVETKTGKCPGKNITCAGPCQCPPNIKQDHTVHQGTHYVGDTCPGPCQCPPNIKQDHTVHQGTHYVGDTCPGAHEAKPEPHAELLVMYRQLPTPELKAHVEAALDAAVERGISKKPTPKKRR